MKASSHPALPYQPMLDQQPVKVIRMNGFHNPESLQPHRHGFYMLQIVLKGYGHHRVDFRDHTMTKGQLYFLHQHQVHQVLEYPQDGWLVLFNQMVFDNLSQCNPVLDGVGLLDYFNGMPVLQLSSDGLTLMDQLCALLGYECDSGAPIPVLEKYLAIMLLHANEQYQHLHGAQVQSHEVITIRRLKKLISKHYRKEWDTPFYAHQLAVPARKLNEISKRLTGKMVAELVHERLISEAEALLVITDLAVKEIAFQLGFTDSPHFSRSFKREKGITPSEFRYEHANTSVPAMTFNAV